MVNYFDCGCFKVFQPAVHLAITFESGDLCIPVSFDSKESGSTTFGRYLIDYNNVKHI